METKIKILKLENEVIIKKYNGKYLKVPLIIQFVILLFISLLSLPFFSYKIMIYFFIIGVGLHLLSIIPYRLSYLADEEMIIKKDQIFINFYFGKIPLKKIKIVNDDFLDVSYSTLFETSLGMYITLKMPTKFLFSILNPNKYRLMKLTYENKTYSFGYDLSENDYNTIKNLILEQRETR